MHLASTVLPDLVNGVIVVELHGTLSLSTASELRAVLLKCLAQEPDVIIVDVADLRLQHRAHLAVLPDALRVHDSPGITMVLCGATGELREQLQGRTLGDVTTQPDQAAALASVASTQARGGQRLSHRLSATAGAPRTARGLVVTACTEWGIEELCGPASLVVSELVSNAVQHAGTDLVLRLARRGDLLHVSVRDGSRVPPTAPSATTGGGPLAEGGRGLHLVQAYAACWGTNIHPDGKTVWTTLRLPSD